MRSYMNRCVKCEGGRAGTCPWTSRFPAPEADCVSSPEPSKETHEDRALTLHEKAGAPCKDQITLDDFIDQVDEFIHGAILPASTDELLETLTYFEHFLSRLRRLTRNFKPVFNDSILAAVEHVLAHIDFAFLKKKLDIEVLIHGIHPDYNRDLMLDRCGFPQTLVKQYRKRARPYKDPDAPAETQAADPIAISAAELPPELSSPQAMVIWHKAQELGLVDNHYHFLGKQKNELANFAGSFSMKLFKEIRWAPFEAWHPYDNYIKTYSAYSQLPPKKETETMKKIKTLFQ